MYPQQRSFPRSFASSGAAVIASPALRTPTPDNWTQATSSPYFPGNFLGLSKPTDTRSPFKPDHIKSVLSTAGEAATHSYSLHTPSDPSPALVGLNNLGNTCYLNAVLQCLFHTPALIDALINLPMNSINPHSKLNGQFISSFISLIRNVKNRKKSSVTPEGFKAVLERFAGEFRGDGQHDAHELLRIVLDALHEELNRVRGKEPYREMQGGADYATVASRWMQYYRKRDDSLVTDLFRGQLLTSTLCSHCHSQSSACDTFLDLSLPLPSLPSSLESCLQSFTSPQSLSDYKCAHCRSKSPSLQTISLWKLPPILVIHLKRFSSFHFHSQKLTTDINFPTDSLNLRPFAPFSTDISLQSPLYRLFGIIQHQGSLEYGHYTA